MVCIQLDVINYLFIFVYIWLGCLLVACLQSQQRAMYLRDGSAQTNLRGATMRQKLQIKLSTSPNHSILTPGQPVPVLTLWHQVPCRVATGVPIFISLVWLHSENFPGRKWESNPRSSTLEADALTTRPMRQFIWLEHSRKKEPVEIKFIHLLLFDEESWSQVGQEMTLVYGDRQCWLWLVLGWVTMPAAWSLSLGARAALYFFFLYEQHTDQKSVMFIPLACWLSILCVKSFSIKPYIQTFQANSFIPAALLGTINFCHFIPWSVASIMAYNHKVSRKQNIRATLLSLPDKSVRTKCTCRHVLMLFVAENFAGQGRQFTKWSTDQLAFGTEHGFWHPAVCRGKYAHTQYEQASLLA